MVDGIPLVTNIQPYSYLDNGQVVKNRPYGPLKSGKFPNFRAFRLELTVTL